MKRPIQSLYSYTAASSTAKSGIAAARAHLRKSARRRMEATRVKRATGTTSAAPSAPKNAKSSFARRLIPTWIPTTLSSTPSAMTATGARPSRSRAAGSRSPQGALLRAGAEEAVPVDHVLDVRERPEAERAHAREPEELDDLAPAQGAERKQREEREREERRRLRADGEADREPREREPAAAAVEHEHGRGGGERRADKVVLRRRRLEHDLAQGAEEEGGEERGRAREAHPPRKRVARDEGHEPGHVLRQRREPVAVSEHEGVERRDLRVRREDVQPLGVRPRQVADRAVLVPGRRARQVVGHRVPVVRRSDEARKSSKSSVRPTTRPSVRSSGCRASIRRSSAGRLGSGRPRRCQTRRTTAPTRASPATYPGAATAWKGERASVRPTTSAAARRYAASSDAASPRSRSDADSRKAVAPSRANAGRTITESGARVRPVCGGAARTRRQGGTGRGSGRAGRPRTRARPSGRPRSRRGR